MASSSRNSAQVGRIRVSTSKIYIGGGRRCLTKASAYRREAIHRIAKKYPCECDAGDGITSPYSCERHSWSASRWPRLVRRLARFLVFLDEIERRRA